MHNNTVFADNSGVGMMTNDPTWDWHLQVTVCHVTVMSTVSVFMTMAVAATATVAVAVIVTVSVTVVVALALALAATVLGLAPCRTSTTMPRFSPAGTEPTTTKSSARFPTRRATRGPPTHTTQPPR